MFYNLEILSKKGKLARVWLAAHYDKKLTKPQILSTDIVKAIYEIVGEGQVPMALRILGHLLLGIARLYARKADYLLKDCNDAIVTIKLAFRPGAATTTTGAQKARKTNVATSNAITLRDPAAENDYDISVQLDDLGDISINIEMDDMQPLSFDQSNLYQASYSDITLSQIDNSGLGPLQSSFDQPGAAINDFDLPPMELPQDESTDFPSGIPVGRESESGRPSVNLEEPEPMMLEISGLPPADESFAIEPEQQENVVGIEPEPEDPLNATGIEVGDQVMHDVDPEADAQDAAAAIASRRAHAGAREIRVRSDARSTILSAEEMNHNFENTHLLERELRFVPGNETEMQLLMNEYALLENDLDQPNSVPTAGIADELGDLISNFTNFLNPFEDLPPALNEQTLADQDVHPPSPVFIHNLPEIDFGQEDHTDLPGDQNDMPFDHDYDHSNVGDIEHARNSHSHLGDDIPEQEEGRFSVPHRDIPIPDSQSSSQPTKRSKKSATQDLVANPSSFSARTTAVHNFIRNQFKKANDPEEISLQQFARGTKRGSVARTFFELLALKSKNVIDLRQEAPYSEIFISKSENFATTVTA